MQKKLLQWYHKNRRDLPWRRTRDPYKIWISEVMLQQTTVETVIPYYRRFLTRFPTVEALAKADGEEVLKFWSGLGYYSRVRNLHKAANLLRSGGASKGLWRRFQPDDKTFAKRQDPTVKELIQLPGIGRYTAGAIASIAFGERAPVLDGNVIRVLSRLFAIKKDPKSGEGRDFFWEKAEEILPTKNCGHFNQALMELGATICLPTQPRCSLCPISSRCVARREGDPESFPKGKRKIVYRKIRMVAAVIQRDGKILVIRRPDKGLLKGMWELPMMKGNEKALTQKWPLQVIRRLPTVRHSVLNRRLQILPIVCRLKRSISSEITHLWIEPSQIGTLPTSSMNDKILKYYK